MKLPQWARYTSLAVALLAALSSTSLLRAQQAPAAGPTDITVGGKTVPSIHTKLALPQFGQVMERPVKEGDHVKKGQVLLRQDDRQERALLEALRLEAESTVRIEAAEADLKIKQVQHKRYEELARNGNASPTELEEYWVKVIYADAQVKIARLENDKHKQEFERQKFKVDQMTLKSEFDGIVETIDVQVGEVTDPQKPVMTVVKNDPLWVELFLPTSQAGKLKVGQQLEVSYVGANQFQPAKVIYRSPFADPSSDTQKIRLEMPNPQGVDSGLQVLVRLPANVGPASPAPTAAVPGLDGPGGAAAASNAAAANAR